MKQRFSACQSSVFLGCNHVSSNLWSLLFGVSDKRKSSLNFCSAEPGEHRGLREFIFELEKIMETYSTYTCKLRLGTIPVQKTATALEMVDQCKK